MLLTEALTGCKLSCKHSFDFSWALETSAQPECITETVSCRPLLEDSMLKLDCRICKAHTEQTIEQTPQHEAHLEVSQVYRCAQEGD